ncbi:MAG: pyridoxal phosphate-dependent aminotransferase [Gammaproteobacteria bacterium]
MKLAAQLANLGTETAFAVAAMAAKHRANGGEVFPFHLGDLNIPPPEPIVRAAARAIKNGKNGYCPGAGAPLLREQLARVLGIERGIKLTPENISVQPGGKPVIGKFLSALTDPGDEVLYPLPGFPIYASQIRYLNRIAKPYRYHAKTGGGFVLDTEAMRKAVSSKTRALIFNNYHNPTGAAASKDEIAEIAAIARDNDLWLLSDDAYNHIRYEGAYDSIASLPNMLERTITLFTCSKQFAMTGWRLGAAVAPKDVADAISRFNTNMESCTAHFIQQAVGEVLRDESLPPLITPLVKELQARRDMLISALQKIDGIIATAPPSGFYVYADISGLLRRKNLPNADALMRESLAKTGVSFCTGEHFGEDADTKHIRFAFSGISADDIKRGIAVWQEWINE